MADVTLGKTQITVNKNGFGCLPIQRISKEEAAKLLRKAREKGITFFDTARAYSDSEEKLGEGFRRKLGRYLLCGHGKRRRYAGGLPEGPGNLSGEPEKSLCGHLSVPQSGLLS